MDNDDVLNTCLMLQVNYALSILCRLPGETFYQNLLLQQQNGYMLCIKKNIIIIKLQIQHE